MRESHGRISLARVMFATLVALTALAQVEVPPPEPAKPAGPVKVTVESEARGVSLLDRASRKVLCQAPCGELLPRPEGAEFLLTAPGAYDSDPFSLTNAADDIKVRWFPATPAARIFGVILTVVGGAAVMAAIGVGVASLVIGISCVANNTACPRFDWAWSALPLSVGGYLALGFGMTLTFRYGVEGLHVEAVTSPSP